MEKIELMVDSNFFEVVELEFRQGKRLRSFIGSEYVLYDEIF